MDPAPFHVFVLDSVREMQPVRDGPAPVAKNPKCPYPAFRGCSSHIPTTNTVGRCLDMSLICLDAGGFAVYRVHGVVPSSA